MTKTRRLAVSMVGLLAVPVCIAAVAYACTNVASLSISTTSALPGSKVTAIGDSFAAGSVTLHWDTATGPTLATATAALRDSNNTAGGTIFSAVVEVPDVSAGVYTIVAVGPEGTSRAAALEVLQPTPPAQGNPAAGTDPGPAAAQDASPAAAPDASPAQAAPTAAVQAAKPVATKPVANGSKPAAGRGDNTTRPARHATSRPSANRAPAAATVPTGVSTASGQQVFTGSVVVAKPKGSAPGGSRGGAARGGKTSQQPAVTAVPQAAAAAPAKALPSLTSGTDALALKNGPGSQLPIGLALLALGLIAPMAGFLVADARRRRAKVSAD